MRKLSNMPHTNNNYTHVAFRQGTRADDTLSHLVRSGMPNNRLVKLETATGKVFVDLRDLHPTTFELLDTE